MEYYIVIKTYDNGYEAYPSNVCIVDLEFKAKEIISKLDKLQDFNKNYIYNSNKVKVEIDKSIIKLEKPVRPKPSEGYLFLIKKNSNGILLATELKHFNKLQNNFRDVENKFKRELAIYRNLFQSQLDNFTNIERRKLAKQNYLPPAELVEVAEFLDFEDHSRYVFHYEQIKMVR